MKKIIYSTLFLLLFSPSTALRAQYVVDSDSDRVSINSNEGNEVVSITSQDKTGDIRISVAGIAITLGEKEADDKPARAPRFGQSFSSEWGMLEIGASMLTEADYSLYGDGRHTFMDLGRKSIHVVLNCGDVGFSLNRSGSFGISTGLTVVWDNYVFANNISLANDGGIVKPFALPDNIKKSKLTTRAIRIPLMLDLTIARQIHLAAGVYGEWATAWTKYKYPKTRSYAIGSDINSLRWGFLAKLGVSDLFYVYGEYGMTPLFRTDRGPVTQPVSVGLGWGF